MTVKEAYKFYTGEIGITPNEFYESTPYELELKLEGYLEAQKRNLKLQSYMTSVAINNVLNKKKIKLFEENETRLITVEEKQNELAYLKEKFGE